MSVILDGFRLLDAIGHGGMGTVYRAVHLETDTAAAIKCMSPQWASDARYRERLRKEVHLVAKLRHPGIVAVYDFGIVPAEFRHPAVVSGTPWLAMELADAGNLGQYREAIRSWGALRPLVVSMLRALGHLHSRGLVHRDLKPENVLFKTLGDGRRRLLVSDFGISHPISAELPAITRDVDAVSAGTPGYMAPEQVRGAWRMTGPWTDLYALGCIVYEFVCGELPFRGDSALAIAMKHLSAERPPLRPRFDVPDGLQRWIHRSMDPVVYRRFERAADALAALPPGDDDSTRLVPTIVGSTDETREFEPATTVVRFESVPYEESRGTPAPIFSANDVTAPPRDWRLQRDEYREDPPVFGTGLVGVAEVPLVGRDMEVDQLWSALLRARSSGEMKIVAVRGAQGGGKTSLTEFFMRRMHELGVASWARFDCTRTPWREAVRRTVATTLNGYGLSAGRILRRANEFVDGFMVVDDPNRAARELAALAVADDEHADWLPKLTGDERDRVLIDFGTAYARRVRPLIFCIDRPEGELAARRFVSALQRGVDAPILVVLEIRSETWEPRAELGAVERIDLEHLPADELARLARRLAPLPPAEAQLLASRDGATAEWIVQVLARSARTGEDPLNAPVSLDDLWRLEAESLARVFDVNERQALVAAMRLGSSVDEDEWREIAVDPDAVEAVATELSRRGHIRRFVGTITFEQERFRDAVLGLSS